MSDILTAALQRPQKGHSEEPTLERKYRLQLGCSVARLTHCKISVVCSDEGIRDQSN